MKLLSINEKKSISKNLWLRRNLYIARNYASDAIRILETNDFPNKRPFYGHWKIQEAFNSAIEGLHIGTIRTKDALKMFREYRDEIDEALNSY